MGHAVILITIHGQNCPMKFANFRPLFVKGNTAEFALGMPAVVERFRRNSDMARVFISDRPDTKHVYTVEKSVGAGGQNVRDDVLLVQFFLRRMMENGTKSLAYLPPVSNRLV